MPVGDQKNDEPCMQISRLEKAHGITPIRGWQERSLKTGQYRKKNLIPKLAPHENSAQSHNKKKEEKEKRDEQWGIQ